MTAGGKITVVNAIKDRLPRTALLHFDDYSFEGEVEDFSKWVSEGADVHVWNLSPLKTEQQLSLRHCPEEQPEGYLRRAYIQIGQYICLPDMKATAKYMDEKVAHYEAILARLAPDDTNPKKWTRENRPKHENL